MKSTTIYVQPIKQKRNYSGYSYWTEYSIYQNDIEIKKCTSNRTNLSNLKKIYEGATIVKLSAKTWNF